jgi:RecA-family ATPase
VPNDSAVFPLEPVRAGEVAGDVRSDVPPVLGWLERASDLLAEGDPGPTPFLVDELILDGAIAAVVGSYKVAKSFSLLELCLAIVTGREAFGIHAVPRPGPVVIVMEESGRAAFHRRLDMLVRGYALEPAALKDLHFAANAGVRLNEADWQDKLLLANDAIRPRAIILDPLVRLKGATVSENEQREIGPVLDFMRLLRDQSGAALIYSQHTGHKGTHQRGSSDLEGYWESRLQVEKEDDGTRIVTADHREAESGYNFRFLLDFDQDSRSLRMQAVQTKEEQLVERWLRDQPEWSANKIADAIGGNRQRVLRLVKLAKERKAGEATA